MIYELRHYYINDGKRSEFVKIMDSIIIPFQQLQGMEVVGSFTDSDNDSCYIWIRRYKDEGHKKEVYDRVYGSDYWKTEVRPKIDGMINKEKSQVSMMSPSLASTLQ